MSFLRTTVALGLALASVHCAQILGDDYCKADDADCPTTSTSNGTGNSAGFGGEGGSGASGGATGGGGAGGTGGSFTLLDCALDEGSITEIASLSGQGIANQWDSLIEMAATDDSAIIYTVARLVNGDGEHLEIYRHGEVGIQRDVTDGGRLLASAADGSTEEALFLFQEEPTLLVKLARWSYNTATPATVQIVVDPAITLLVNAAMVAPAASGDVAVVLREHMGDPKAYFLLHTGPFAVPNRFTTADAGLDIEEVRPMGLLENGSGGFFAFLGAPGTSVDIGTRIYDLTATPSEQPPATTFQDQLHLVHATASGDDYTLTVEDSSTAGTFALRSDTLASAAVASATPETFPETASIDSSTLPSSPWRFRTPTHVVIMGKSLADPKIGDLTVVSYADGLQATGTVDFSPVALQQIEAFMLRPRDAFPATPRLDGAVMTSHGAYKKLFTFEVACTVP